MEFQWVHTLVFMLNMFLILILISIFFLNSFIYFLVLTNYTIGNIKYVVL